MAFGGVNPARYQRRQKVLAIAGAVVIAFICVAIVTVFVNDNTSKASEGQGTTSSEVKIQIEMADVLVPVSDLDTGTKLMLSMFRKESRPRSGLPPNVIRDFEEVQGFYAKTSVAANVPLTKENITLTKPSNAITIQIPDGYRAVTIRVDAETAVEGWAKAGARVDVGWTARLQNEEVFSCIVQNAQVLSAERITRNDGSQPAAKEVGVPSTVTLLASVKDAAKIQLAARTGKLTLSLRGDGDPGKDGCSGVMVTQKDLFNQQGPKVVEEKCEASVRVRRDDGTYEELCMDKGGDFKPRHK